MTCVSQNYNFVYPRKSGHYTPEKVAIIPPKKWPLWGPQKSGINTVGIRGYRVEQKTFRLYKLFKPDRGMTAASRWSPPTPQKRIKKKHRGYRDTSLWISEKWNRKNF